MNTICFLIPTPNINPVYYKNCPHLYLDEVFGRGQYNGYVGIDKETWDKYIGVYSYFDLPNDFPQPHGGVTYLTIKEKRLGDIPIIAIDNSFDTNLEDYVIIGFDTLHFGDNYTKWDFDAVRNETRRWRDEIVDYILGKY